jgi:hypothetical protein
MAQNAPQELSIDQKQLIHNEIEKKVNETLCNQLQDIFKKSSDKIVNDMSETLKSNLQTTLEKDISKIVLETLEKQMNNIQPDMSNSEKKKIQKICEIVTTSENKTRGIQGGKSLNKHNRTKKIQKAKRNRKKKLYTVEDFKPHSG